ncbi:MAG: hypothetical protein AAF999_03670 [Pseudomonadota bacterium]
MAERFSLKDHLFNAVTIGQLAQEYASADAGFDPKRFRNEVLAGFAERELLARLDWIADCLELQLSQDFNVMADQLEAAMPPILDPARTDDDFGHFIHAVPGILAVRHGLEHHRTRAMELLYNATQRFSMEFYIRPFLNRWPDETLADLSGWAGDPNYHVRRLVSEGTRPKLPWAKAVSLTPEQTLPLLNALHSDKTRYVTRSVANHLNDLSKTAPENVLATFEQWEDARLQTAKELDWMKRHALRTLIKAGDSRAMTALGFRGDVPVEAEITLANKEVRIGDALRFSCAITSKTPLPVLLDYRIHFARPDGRAGSKVFKLKQGETTPEEPFTVTKAHKIKADATTFTWYPGEHRLVLQVNGVDRDEVRFTVTAP